MKLLKILKESIRILKEGEDYNYLECMRSILTKYPEFKERELDVLEPFWEMHQSDIMGRVETGEKMEEVCLEEFENYLSVNPEI